MQGIHQLRTYRHSQEPRLSQQALADKIGVSRLTVTRWETGERRIAPSLVPVVAEKTGIAPKDLRPDFAKTYGEDAEAIQ